MFVGGIATILGPALGAFLITYATNSLASSGPWRSIVLSMLILIVLWFCPGGLIGGTQRIIRLIASSRGPSSDSPVAASATPPSGPALAVGRED
jgi:MFS family permease